LKAVMLTTVDNPFDPFTQFDEWYACDLAKANSNNRLDTCSYLAKIAMNATEVSDADANLLNEFAIDEIVKHNPLGIYKKVERDIAS